MSEELFMSSLTFRSPSFRFAAAALLFCGLAVPRAHAVSKEMIQLQTQIQQLQDAVARLQQSNDERMGVLKDLVQQTADSVNKMSVDVNGLKLAMQNQQEALGAKSDQLSGQVQAMNDSIDEVKARLARMEKALGNIQSQQQSTAAILSNLPQGSATQPNNPPPTGAPANGVTPGPAPTQPLPTTDTPQPDASAAPPSAGPGPSAQDMYRTAYSDYMSGKYPVAASEFGDLIKAYPDDNLSGNAYFYQGEMLLRTQKLAAAVKDYDHLLEHYPDNSKIPAAHLHKGEAMLAQKQTDGGVRELRALIQRFPNSPEATQARQKLTSMHVPASPK
jgi:tol-pal system protein YbgF